MKKSCVEILLHWMIDFIQIMPLLAKSNLELIIFNNGNKQRYFWPWHSFHTKDIGEFSSSYVALNFDFVVVLFKITRARSLIEIEEGLFLILISSSQSVSCNFRLYWK